MKQQIANFMDENFISVKCFKKVTAFILIQRSDSV